MATDIGRPGSTEDSDRSTHIGAGMSARPQRIEVITRGERRRRWLPEEKQAIVEDSLAPNASIMAIARKHGIGTRQLYNWRHQLLGPGSGKAARFARVDIAEPPSRLAGPIVPSPSSSAGLIEIVLVGGPTIRVNAQVDEHALRRVLGVLRG